MMKVLVALDGGPLGESAATAITTWAAEKENHVLLFQVVDPGRIHESIATAPPHTIVPGGTASGQRLDVSEPRPRVVEDRSQAIERARTETTQRLQSTAARLLPGANVETAAEVNENVAGAIVQKARGIGADLVVMSTRSRGGLGRALLGSVAERVVHDSPVPVVLVGPEARKTGPAQTAEQTVVSTPPADPAQAIAERDRAIRSASVEQLVAWLAGDDWQLRRGARLELATRSESAPAVLVDAARYGGTEARLEAVRVLRDIADPGSVPTLIAALEDRNPSTRWAAAEALIAVGQPSVRPVLRELINKSDSVWLQEGAHHVLQHLVEPVTSPVVNALEGPYPSITVPPLVHEALKAMEI
jgi:nucleotide-binding universal stress UspA family protein